MWSAWLVVCTFVALTTRRVFSYFHYVSQAGLSVDVDILDERSNAWLKAQDERKSADAALRDLSYMDFAIVCGRLDVVQSLYRQGFHADAKGLNLAIVNGHVELVLGCAPTRSPSSPQSLRCFQSSSSSRIHTLPYRSQSHTATYPGTLLHPLAFSHPPQSA